MDLTDENAARHDLDPEDAGSLSFLHGRDVGVPEGRLPRGQHDLAPQFVARHQRSRIVEAMTNVTHEIGYLDLTVADVVKHARVSRRTFYEHFTDKQHCYITTFGTCVECIADAVRSAYNAEEQWDDRVAAAFSAFGRLIVEHPAAGYICFVQSGASGAEAERSRAAAVHMCAAAFAAVVHDCDEAAEVSPLQCELAVEAVTGVARTRLSEGRSEALAHELPEAVATLLAGVIGPARARGVADRIALPVVVTAAEPIADQQRAKHP